VLFVLLVIVHVTVCLALILVVLLQVGKGQSIGAAFGGAGSSQTFFGSRGPATFLSRLTTASAALFMLTSLGLAYMSSGGGQNTSILDKMPAPAADTAPTPAPTPDASAPMVPSTEQAPVVMPQTDPAPLPAAPAPTQEAPAPAPEAPKKE